MDFRSSNHWPAASKSSRISTRRRSCSRRFEDVVYHHCPDLSFMTCRIDETLRATGERREQRSIELYRFRDGKLAMKDVYRKPIAG